MQINLDKKIKNELDKKICQTICTRVAFVHKFVKEKYKLQEELFSGDLQPTGRTFGFIGKEFKKYFMDNNSFENPNVYFYKPICNSIISFYANSFNPDLKEGKDKIDNSDIEKNKFINDLVNKFKEYVSDFNLDELSKSKKYYEIFIILKQVQEYSLNPLEENKNINFDFPIFVKKILEKTELGDIKLINDHISDTLNLLSNIKDSTKEKDLYYQIKIINDIFNNLEKNQISEYINRKLNDKELLENDILKTPISKLCLLEELSKNKSIFRGNIKCIFLNDNVSKLTEFIKKLYSEKNQLSFKRFLNH